MTITPYKKFLPLYGSVQRQLILLTFLTLCFVLWGSVLPGHAAWRAGATRPLNLEWGQTNAPGSILRAGLTKVAAFEGVLTASATNERTGRTGGPSSWALYFTREANGTRNIWRAIPQPAAGASGAAGSSTALASPAAENTSGAASAASSNALRNLTWRATPITHLTGSLFAEQPAISPDGRVLLCVTNAFAGANAAIAPGGRSAPGGNVAPRTQIARLDVQTNRWTTLTNNDAHDRSPVIAPNGQRVAFVSDRTGLESIYIMPLGGGTARRLVTMARNPCWLGNSTIIFQSTRPGQVGLFRLAVPADGVRSAGEPRPTRLFDRVGEVAASPDSQMLCVATEPGPTVPRRDGPGADANPQAGRAGVSRQIYLLAPDGSSARAITGTEGARSPRFTPDGSAVLFDAPLETGFTAAPPENPANNTGANAGEPQEALRTLWLLPVLHVPPTAVLLKVQPAKKPNTTAIATQPATNVDELEILGTAFAEGTVKPAVTLEYGEGAEPTRWDKLTVQRVPVQQGLLARWRVPADAQGDWTLRLTVTDGSNETAQTTYPVTLPFAEKSPFEGNALIFPGYTSPQLPTTPATPNSPVQSNSVLLRTAPTLPSTQTPSAAQTPSEIEPSEPEPPIQPLQPGATSIFNNSRIAELPAPAPVRIGSQTPKSVTTSPVRVPPSGVSRTGNAPGNSNSKLPPRLAGPVPPLPLPALPPAPTPGPAPQTGTTGTTPTFNPPVMAPGSGDPAGNQSIGGPLPPAPNPKIYSKPTTRKTRTRKTSRMTRPFNKARSARLSNAPAVQSIESSNAQGNGTQGDAARIRVSGTPASMQVGESVPVVATLENTGSRAWISESEQPVRLVYRWVDAATGTRTRWAIQWLRSDVRPGGSTQLSFSLGAPPRPGRFKLNYILLRLSGPKFEAPLATLPNQRWPGEFGSSNFYVTVR